MSKTFDWPLWPDTEVAVDAWIDAACEGNAFARRLGGRMAAEAGLRFHDWVDHLVVRDGEGLQARLRALGYARRPVDYAFATPAYGHDGGIFPAIALTRVAGPSPVCEVAIKVESIAAFSAAHDLGLDGVGDPLGPYRVARVPGRQTGLAVIERRGFRGFDPFASEAARDGRLRPTAARDAIAARELWLGRRRAFEDAAEGFEHTDSLLERVIERAGSTDLACHLVFEGEREYWQSRNRAGRGQKARQDRLGLGWANHDHHTYRSSRRNFPRLIALFERLGFGLRERYHAGARAGWGAQILEHPTTGVVIFADLDLAAEEVDDDFAHKPRPDLDRPNTVGLWVGLHGESILAAGMHHLEAQFDFEAMRQGLLDEAGVETMPPFSDFPFLRQAFTAGERWAVDPRRADRCRELGWIDAAEHERFVREGAIGSHLENLQRRQGYKGFNQQSVSAILAATDPRRH